MYEVIGVMVEDCFEVCGDFGDEIECLYLVVVCEIVNFGECFGFDYCVD